MTVVLFILGGYLCGSIPSGVFFARHRGVDVRSTGSGNIGATNVARTAGVGPALLTLAFDVSKGFLPTMIASATLHSPSAAALVGGAAFLGHLFPIFLHFSGGKGVSTGFGVFAALAPASAAISLGVFVAVALACGYVSLASVLAALVLATACALLGYDPPVWVAATVVAALIVARHQANIRRLWRGTEPKFHVKST
jgi:glycerol-3-phosphate acyltransferase PlsY